MSIPCSDYSMAAILGLNGSARSRQNDVTDMTIPRRRRNRTVYSPEAIDKLEKLFLETQYPDIHQRERLSTDIGVPEARIQVWFQNRRSRTNKKRQDRRAVGKPAAKRKLSSDSETESDSSSATEVDRIEETATKVPRLNNDYVDKTVSATKASLQREENFPYTYLPPFYSSYFSQPYFYNPALGHPHYALLATSGQSIQPCNPFMKNLFNYVSMPPVPSMPTSPIPYFDMSPPALYNTDLSQSIGVQQRYDFSPALFSSDLPTQKRSETKTQLFVPPLKQSTESSIRELSSPDTRVDDNNHFNYHDSRADSPAFSLRTESSLSLDSYTGADSGFGQDLSSDSSW